jgi:hypothetical protein
MLPACGGRGSSSAIPPDRMQTPNSVSPASFKVAPMVQTPIQPASVMASRHPQNDIQALGWTQLPGGGIFVAASPDGSLWVLSSIGSGPDRSIWHYANGNWTNIPGAAMRMWVAPNGTLWVINSAGGIYAYNGSWTGIAGGASDITVGADGSVYVVSNQGNGIYGRGIWRYSGGSWTQLPGAAVRIAASWDTGTYPGKIDPGGFWVTNALGGIYYYSPIAGFNQIPGGVAQVAPTKSGGLFALGYLVNPDGSYPIYYNNLATGNWAQQPGAATSISTDGTSVYVTGAAGGIYKAAVTPRTTPDAPAVGYLAPTGTGSFAGVLTGFTAGATVVGISTDELVGSPSNTVGQGNLAFSLGSNVLSTSRRPAALPAAPSIHHGYRERPVQSAAEIDAVMSKLRVNTSIGRGALAYRRASALPTTLGSHTSFWLTVSAIGSSSGYDIQVPATLQATPTSGYVWVDDTLSLSAATIAKIAGDLDNAYASDTAHFGPTGFTASAPGIVNHPGGYYACDTNGVQLPVGVPRFVVPPDSKIHAFILNEGSLGAGVGGYFTPFNYVPQAAYNCFIGTYPTGGGPAYTAQTIPHSNEAPMIYIGWNTSSSTSVLYNTDEDLVRSTSHEMQHLINYVDHVLLNDVRYEDSWINEGLSMLSQDFALNRKFGIAHDVDDAFYYAQQYLLAPQNFSVTAFTGMDSTSTSWKYNCNGCYGAEYLFQRYLYDRFGGDTYLSKMLGANYSYANLQQATGVDPHVLISDFAIALAASGTGKTTDPRFGFTTLSLPTPYADQFGRMFAAGAPQIVSGLQPSPSPYLGSFVYYSLTPSANGQTLSGKDLGGGFGLQIGVVKQ